MSVKSIFSDDSVTWILCVRVPCVCVNFWTTSKLNTVSLCLEYRFSVFRTVLICSFLSTRIIIHKCTLKRQVCDWGLGTQVSPGLPPVSKVVFRCPQSPTSYRLFPLQNKDPWWWWFVTDDKSRTRGKYKKGCRCGKRLRDKTGVCQNLTHTWWSETRDVVFPQDEEMGTVNMMLYYEKIKDVWCLEEYSSPFVFFYSLKN
jgi:hypothetical protein